MENANIFPLKFLSTAVLILVPLVLDFVVAIASSKCTALISIRHFNHPLELTDKIMNIKTSQCTQPTPFAKSTQMALAPN